MNVFNIINCGLIAALRHNSLKYEAFCSRRSTILRKITRRITQSSLIFFYGLGSYLSFHSLLFAVRTNFLQFVNIFFVIMCIKFSSNLHFSVTNAVAIAQMDPGRDSVIYRMTSNRMKKDN